MENFKNLPPLESDTELVAKPNVFAGIIAGHGHVSEVYRDDLVMVFMDIQPINPGHTLVVPLRSARFLDELNDDEVAQMMLVGRKVARAIRASDLPNTGILMFLADGASAGQEVPHVHLHVLPRLRGDGFGFSLPERYHSDLPARERLDEDAAKLQAALAESFVLEV